MILFDYFPTSADAASQVKGAVNCIAREVEMPAANGAFPPAPEQQRLP